MANEADERKELAELEELHQLEQQHAAQEGGTPAPPGDMSATDVVKAMGSHVLDVGSRAMHLLNYTGGLANTGLAAIHQALNPGKDILRWEDVKHAIDPISKQGAITQRELNIRRGLPANDWALSSVVPGFVPHGQGSFMHPEEGGMLDVSAKDILADPMTWLSLGGSSLVKKARLAKLENSFAKPEAQTGLKGVLDMGKQAYDKVENVLTMPAQLASEGVSKVLPKRVDRMVQARSQFPSAQIKDASQALYDSGIKPIIQTGRKWGNPNVGQTLIDEAVTGSPVAVNQGMSRVADKYKGLRDQILDAVDATGPKASTEASHQGIHEALDQLVRDQRITPEHAEKITKELSDARIVRPKDPALGAESGLPVTGATPDLVPTQRMSQWKTDYRQSLPSSTWNELATTSPKIADKIKMEAANGAQKEIERAATDTLGAGAGSELSEHNKKLGDVINPHVQTKATTLANTHERSPLIGVSDLYAAGAGAMGGGAMSHAPEGAFTAFVVKKLIDAMNSTSFRTRAGHLGYKAMQSPLLSTGVNEATKQLMVRGLNPYATEEK